MIPKPWNLSSSYFLLLKPLLTKNKTHSTKWNRRVQYYQLVSKDIEQLALGGSPTPPMGYLANWFKSSKFKGGMGEGWWLKVHLTSVISISTYVLHKINRKNVDKLGVNNSTKSITSVMECPQNYVPSPSHSSMVMVFALAAVPEAALTPWVVTSNNNNKDD